VLRVPIVSWWRQDVLKEMDMEGESAGPSEPSPSLSKTSAHPRRTSTTTKATDQAPVAEAKVTICRSSCLGCRKALLENYHLHHRQDERKYYDCDVATQRLMEDTDCRMGVREADDASAASEETSACT
jgi:hypothetical protein